MRAEDGPTQRDTVATVLKRSVKRHRSLSHRLLLNCLTLIVIFTLCLYGLGLISLYLRWFVLESPPPNVPAPIIITVVLPTTEGGSEPIIVTVVVTATPRPATPTPTLEPTPTQSWPTSFVSVPTSTGPSPIVTGSPVARSSTDRTPPVVFLTPLAPPFHSPRLSPEQ